MDISTLCELCQVISLLESGKYKAGGNKAIKAEVGVRLGQAFRDSGWTESMLFKVRRSQL